MRQLAALSCLVAALLLAAGDGVAASWLGVLGCVIAGLAGLAGQWRGQPQIGTYTLAGMVGLAALGIVQRAPAGLMLGGLVAALVAWDLDRFARRLQTAEQVQGATAIIGAHLRRLGLVAGLGMLVGAAALGLRIELSFGWALLVGLAAALSLGQVFRWLRRAGG